MVAHMGVVAVAAPLIAIGLPERWRPGASMPVCLAIFASVMELIIVWGWQRAAPRCGRVLDTGDGRRAGVFPRCGIAAVEHQHRRARARHSCRGGCGGIARDVHHMTLLGALLSLSQRALRGGPGHLLRTRAERHADQQIGGTSLLSVGAAVYLAGGRLARGNPARAAAAKPEMKLGKMVPPPRLERGTQITIWCSNQLS